jgi:hypothetical protein
MRGMESVAVGGLILHCLLLFLFLYLASLYEGTLEWYMLVPGSYPLSRLVSIGVLAHVFIKIIVNSVNLFGTCIFFACPEMMSAVFFP